MLVCAMFLAGSVGACRTTQVKLERGQTVLIAAVVGRRDVPFTMPPTHRSQPEDFLFADVSSLPQNDHGAPLLVLLKVWTEDVLAGWGYRVLEVDTEAIVGAFVVPDEGYALRHTSAPGTGLLPGGRELKENLAAMARQESADAAVRLTGGCTTKPHHVHCEVSMVMVDSAGEVIGKSDAYKDSQTKTPTLPTEILHSKCVDLLRTAFDEAVAKARPNHG